MDSVDKKRFTILPHIYPFIHTSMHIHSTTAASTMQGTSQLGPGSCVVWVVCYPSKTMTNCLINTDCIEGSSCLWAYREGNDVK